MPKDNSAPELYVQICEIDAPLNVRLAAYAEKLRENNGPMAAAYDALVVRLRHSSLVQGAPTVGQSMPPFLLPSNNARIVSLEELTLGGPVVISFNRGHWCPFCKIELRTIAAYADEIRALGAQVISIMPDRQQFAAKLRKELNDQVIIATDIDSGYALSLNLVMWLDDTLKALMHEKGLFIDIFQGNDGWFTPFPATFVVGRNQQILSRHIDPEFRQRMDIDAILETLRRA